MPASARAIKWGVAKWGGVDRARRRDHTKPLMANASAEDTLGVQRARNLVQSAGAWISSADAKAVALLTVAGALLALIAAAVAGLMAANEAFRLSRWAIRSFAAFSASSIVSIACSAWALMPRTNRERLLSKAGWKSPLPHSRTFFADVAKLTPTQFNSMLDEPDGSFDERDAREQAFVVQRIAASKMYAIRLGIGALFVGLLALGVFVFEFLR